MQFLRGLASGFRLFHEFPEQFRRPTSGIGPCFLEAVQAGTGVAGVDLNGGAMVTVMCSSALYRALGERTAPKGQVSPDRPARLGDWAATLVDQTVVVAIEARTCLTLVFRIRPLLGFRDRFAAALRRGLQDRRVAPEAIELECRAIREAVLVRRRHPALVEALEFAEIEAGAHVHGGQEEGSVQDMLNEYPYSECPAPCPKDAVTMLFAGRAGAGPKQPAKPGAPAPTVTRS